MNPGSNDRWLLISQEREPGIYASPAKAFNTIHETILEKNTKRTLIKPQVYHQSTGNTRAGEAGYSTTWGYGHKNSEYNKLF